MSYFLNNPYTGFKNVNLKKGILRFSTQLSSAMTGTQSTIYTRGSGASLKLYFWNGTAETEIGATGSGATTTWDAIYAQDTSCAVTGSSMTFAGSHATNDAFTITQGGSSAGACLQLTHSKSGENDVNGTSGTWFVTQAGYATVARLDLADGVQVRFGNSQDCTVDWGGSTLDFSGPVAFEDDVTIASAKSLTIAGTAGTDYLIITAGDILMSEGGIVMTDDDNAATLSITNDGATTIGNGADNGVVEIICDTLTSGTLLHLSVTEGTLNSGYYIKMWDETGDSAVATFGENGVLVIAGTGEGTDSITLTTGDITVSDGDVTISAGLLTITEDATDTTALTVTTAATSTDCVIITADSLTGTESAVLISVDALVDGVGLEIENTGEALTSGELLKITNNESGTIATISGNLASITSTIEETAGTLTANYDLLLLSRTDKQSHASQYDAQGSVLKIDKTQNKAAGTIVDAVVALEIVSTATGSALILGDSVKVTSVGVNERSLNIINACTGKDGVLVTASGALTNGLSAVHITTTGDLATGGANLILEATGTTPHAASSLLELVTAKDMLGITASTATATGDGYYFLTTGATATGKAAMHIEASGTAAADASAVLRVTYSGTATNESRVIEASADTLDVVGLYVNTHNTIAAHSASIVMYDAVDAATGNSIVAHHNSATPAAGDQLLTIAVYGEEATSSDTMLYGQMTFEVVASTDAAIEGGIKMGVADAGSTRESFYLTDDHLGLGDSAAFVLGSTGSYDLTISTQVGAGGLTALEPKIVMTDGATGNITVTAGGTSGEIDLASPVMMSSTQALSGAGAVDLTNAITEVTTTGTDALTLGNGVEGQIKIITMVSDGGEGTLTPTALTGYSTIKFNDVGDSCTLIFTNSSWSIIGQIGCTIA